MAQIGQFALALAFVVTIYSIAASLIGIRVKHDKLIASGRNAAVGTFACLTTAFLCLVYLFVVSDFSINYVAGHSNRDLPLYFKISAIWGGQEGSLLLWGWFLTGYAALVMIQNWRKHTAMMPYVTAVLMGSSLFFTSMHLFIANPFNQIVSIGPGGARVPFVPADGQGLNPLLQYILNAIHPPVMYLGLVGFAVPFAFAMAAMLSRQLGDTWIRTTRRWTMVAWFFLGTAILLGGKWAYVELGWGGFWGWDPVENASLPRVCSIVDRRLFRGLYRHFAFRSSLSAVGSSAPAEKRKPDGVDRFARKQLHVQQPDPAGVLLCGVLGRDVSGLLRVDQGRQDHCGPAVLQQSKRSNRNFSDVPDGCWPASSLA